MKTPERKFTAPDNVQGTPVFKGSEMVMRGEIWVTLLPEQEADQRIWEYSLTTGKLYLVDDGKTD